MGTSVLLIDDDMFVRSTLEDTLIEAGYSVTAFADGREAVRRLADLRADLVVTDLLMPNIDGVELIRQLRSQKPGLKILAISGGGPNIGLQLLDIAGKMGANRTLPKPFSPLEFVEAVRALERGD